MIVGVISPRRSESNVDAMPRQSARVRAAHARRVKRRGLTVAVAVILAIALAGAMVTVAVPRIRDRGLLRAEGQVVPMRPDYAMHPDRATDPFGISVDAALASRPVEGSDAPFAFDENGALMVSFNGDPDAYHPVNAMWAVLPWIEVYRHTGQTSYLCRAEATVRKVLAGAEEVDGALWFTYPWDHTMHGDTTLTAPWYSGMAQGMLLSAAARLAETTGDPAWEETADRIVQSFLAPADAWPTITSFVNRPGFCSYGVACPASAGWGDSRPA